MPRRCDIWRVGIAPAPIGTVAGAGLAAIAVDWLPEEPSFRFLADPFGLWRDGALHLFAEAYDYRTRHGVIDWLRLDASLQPVERARILAEPWHLSYPFVIEHAGETWMLPEAHRSGTLRLYRAVEFPRRWERAAELRLEVVPIDATPVFHDGLWWLFYSGGEDRLARMGSLRVAFAEQLIGPWRPLACNPVRVDLAGARPGGTPFVERGCVMLPVQDCSRTYGGGIRLLRMTRLSTDGVTIETGDTLPLPPGLYREGMHTLSACGPVTLLDVKRIDRSGRGWLIDLQRRLGRWHVER